MSSESVKLLAATDRLDQDLWAIASSRLWQDNTTRAIERSALVVEVRRQEVYLLGHVTRLAYRQRVVELVRGVQGVRTIHNRLVADPELVREVAQALADDPRTRLSMLGVGAFHGWIHLSGVVSDLSTREAAEEVAALVPHVRGVLALPHLPHEHADRGENRRPLQPSTGQAVYAADGAAGLVEQVVISPHSRLVSHIVVTGTREINWHPAHGSWLVPIEAVARANTSGVFLSEPLAALAARLAFSPAGLRLPPPDWQPPFPYRAGDLRWLAEAEPAHAPPLMADFIPIPWPAALSSLTL